MSISNLIHIEQIYSDKVFFNKLIKIAKTYTKDTEQAKDIVQEAFLKILEGYQAIHTNLKAYVKVAVVRKAQDWKKARQVRTDYLFQQQNKKNRTSECSLIRRFEQEQVLDSYLEKVQFTELELTVFTFWRFGFKNQEIQKLLGQKLKQKQVRVIKQSIKRKLDKIN